MNLHKDSENFDVLIRAASRYYNMSPSIIEKDYYVTLILSKLVERIPNLLFKGGTSLSKCYKIINRFSEDIDITLDALNQSHEQRKLLKYTIIEICKSLDLSLVNANEIGSRKDYNCYKIDYSTKFSSMDLKPQLLVETVFMVKAYPSETKSASSIIYDYLHETSNNDIIDKYYLHPFNIKVQTLERTFIDKVFAICDYMIDNNTKRQSRHIYDLSRLLPFIVFDQKFNLLIQEVRNERKKSKKCYSAQDDIDINSLLMKIIDLNIYQNDYTEVTENLLSVHVSYKEAIKSIYEIVNSGVFSIKRK